MRSVLCVRTLSISGQVFMGKNYLENFVQSTFNALKSTSVPIEGGTIVVSGDGRYYNKARCRARSSTCHPIRVEWISLLSELAGRSCCASIFVC